MNQLNESIELTELILRNNQLENVEFIRNMTRLETLDLSQNKIKSLESNGYNLLGRLISLKRLKLSDNQIGTLQPEMFTHLKHRLIEITFEKNPIDPEIERSLKEEIRALDYENQEERIQFDEFDL